MWKLVLLGTLLVAGWSDAQVVTTGSTKAIGRNTVAFGRNSGRDTRDVFLCFIPDTQNQSSQDDEVGSVDNCTQVTQCLPPYCTQSPYCKDTWGSTTAHLLMRNLAYDLTGQWSKIDWTPIKGADPTRSNLTQPLDHPRCDAIISLGDMNDIDNAEIAVDPSYGSLTAKRAREVDTVSDFWQIIKASGIPYLPLRGNHDGRSLYQRLMTTVLSFSSSSFYYGIEPSRQIQYGIVFPTATGKSFCVLGGNSQQSSDTAINNTEASWLNANIGCGAGLPTIIVQHESVQFGGAFGTSATPSWATITANGANTPLIMIAGGHYTPATPGQEAYFVDPGAGGFSYFKLVSDYQEMNRHGNALVETPMGVSASDGAGDTYTIMRIQPQVSKVSFQAWSPYWQSSPDPQVAGGVYTPTRYSFDYNFDGAFP